MNVSVQHLLELGLSRRCKCKAQSTHSRTLLFLLTRPGLSGRNYPQLLSAQDELARLLPTGRFPDVRQLQDKYLVEGYSDGMGSYFPGGTFCEKWSAAMREAENNQAHLLIIDDEPEIRNMLHEFLCESYRCLTANSAEEALALLATDSFDLIISDISLERMSGLEMVPHVLDLAPQTVIIMMSGTQTIESAIEALRVGAFDYIMKPFDLRHVEVAVRRALEHHSLLRAKHRYENYLEELIGKRTTELNHTLNSLEDSYRTTLKALAAALDTRDTETHGHSERVVNFSLRLGQELNLDRDQMRSLEFGALLHDIGKIGIPDAILRKPAPLTNKEWEKMREHPALGQRILRGIEFLDGAARVVGQHHEKWDGSGYPSGLRAEEIDLNARIFAVADAFDAIISDRVYRVGKSYNLAAAELERCAGQHFDPQVVAAFHLVPEAEWKSLREDSVIKGKENYCPTYTADYQRFSEASAVDDHLASGLAKKLQEIMFIKRRNLAA